MFSDPIIVFIHCLNLKSTNGHAERSNQTPYYIQHVFLSCVLTQSFQQYWGNRVKCRVSLFFIFFLQFCLIYPFIHPSVYKFSITLSKSGLNSVGELGIHPGWNARHNLVNNCGQSTYYAFGDMRALKILFGVHVSVRWDLSRWKIYML